MNVNDGQCHAPEVKERERAIPNELSCLTNNVDALEGAVTQLAERLQNGSVPPPASETTASERPPHACPIAESLTQLGERILFASTRIDDLCERVQL